MPVKADQRIPTVKQNYVENNVERASQRWWKEREDKIYASVFWVTTSILKNLTIRRRMNYVFANIYNDIGAAFSSAQHVNLYYNRAAADSAAFATSRMTVNVVQNVIDTAVAMIAKNKPKPQFLTDGAKDYGMKVKGQKLTKYVAGVFDETNLYTIAQRVFQDACIYGTGAIKLYEEDGKVRAEWVFIEEILIDDLEGMYQKPQQIHQRKYVQRNQLEEQFPKFVEQINDAAQFAGPSAIWSTADLIPVVESWHLQSGKNAKDGLHTICIENATLFSEEYKKDYFPIQFFRWADQTIGFWGRGISHEIWKIQMEIDNLYRLIQHSTRLVGGPILQVEAGADIQENHLTSNKIGKIITYTETPAAYLTPPIMQPEVYQHIETLKSDCYQIVGISEQSAGGEKPAGLRSGAAIREAADVAAGRFEIIGLRWEEFFLSLARIIVDISADIFKEDRNLSILTKDRRRVSRIDFKDVVDALDDFELQLFPISGLPSTPAGRLDQLADYAAAGYVSKEQVMDIVDFPDLEDTVSLETASLHLVQEILSNIKEKGEEGYLSPNPFINLSQAFQLSALEVDRAMLQHVPEENIDLLRRWSNECKSLMDSVQQQPAPAAAAPAAGAPAQGQ